MNTSVFDLFKPGVGPSSSHTMGPMTAAVRFLGELAEAGLLARVERVRVTLHGSLALTGRGHATDTAVMLGLMGNAPATLDPDAGDAALIALRAGKRMQLGLGGPTIAFDEAEDIAWEGFNRLPRHPNALRLVAELAGGVEPFDRVYYSTGGGFVASEAELNANAPVEGPPAPHPFVSGAELVEKADAAGLSIAELMLANELAIRPQDEVFARLDGIFADMSACVERGMRMDGVLPGGLKVRRRAKQVRDELINRAERQLVDPLTAMDWVNLWALAVNEENAAGGRVVTAPTNGAAGIVPAVMHYYARWVPGANDDGAVRFLLA